METAMSEDVIPELFPRSLQLLATDAIVQQLLIWTGRRVASRCLLLGHDASGCEDCGCFTHQVSVCSHFLSLHLPSHLMDSVAEQLALLNSDLTDPWCSGYHFAFATLCNDRISHLLLSRKDAVAPTTTTNAVSDYWPTAFELQSAQRLLTSSLCRLSNLSSLIIQTICDNHILRIISQTCLRLQTLDMSYSTKVSDQGLLHLCGVDLCNAEDHRCGCKSLREIRLCQEDPAHSQISPEAMAMMLTKLTRLQIVDFVDLHGGLSLFAQDQPPDEGAMPPWKSSRLRLSYFGGTDDQLMQVLNLCPNLTVLKLQVTDALPDLGRMLKASNVQLDKVSLIFAEDMDPAAADDGFKCFLMSVGSRMAVLELDSPVIWMKALLSVSECCPWLDSLHFCRFKPASSGLLLHPGPIDTLLLRFRFLTNLKLSNIEVDHESGAAMLKSLIAGCPEVERLTLDFSAHSSEFFNDVYFNEMLSVNPMSRLEHFSARNVSLTLISALRLLSSNPKLRSLGHLLLWDVQDGELSSFVAILRKATALKLLSHDISIC